MSPEAEAVSVPFTVSDLHDGARLDAFLTARLHRYSRARVQRLISEGRVTLRGRPAAKASSAVAEGDLIVVRYDRRPDPPSAHASLAVLYEDEHLLAFDKPGDVLSHPTDKVLQNTATALAARQFPGLRLRLAHRLDRETSGALLFSKSPEAARALTAAFTRGSVRKEYLALARGRAPFRRLRLDLPLGPEGGEIKVRQAVCAPGRGAAARTEFETLEVGAKATLVKARPAGGRLHQIRAHLAALGLPIVGDKLYLDGGSAYLKACRKELSAADLEALGAPRQMLHAARLDLAHPITGRPIRVEAPPPVDFLAALAAQGLYYRMGIIPLAKPE